MNLVMEWRLGKAHWTNTHKIEEAHMAKGQDSKKAVKKKAEKSMKEKKKDKQEKKRGKAGLE